MKNNSTRCAVTGSFDPITIGHHDIIKKALADFDLVYVVVLINEDKTSFFTMDERIQVLKKLFKGNKRVIVDSYNGMTVDYCRSKGINIIIRGFRDSRDYEYESIMAKYNYNHGAINTLLIPADTIHGFVSSTNVRIALEENQELDKYLPEEIINLVKEIYKNKVELKNE